MIGRVFRIQRPPEPPRGFALKVGLTSTSQHPAPRTLCRDLLAVHAVR